MEQLQEIKLEANTLIHISGIPFELKAGTHVYGLESNLRLAQQVQQAMGIKGGESTRAELGNVGT